MAINDTYVVSAQGVVDTGTVAIEGSGSDTGAAEVFELGGSADATIYREVDVDGDGTWEIQNTIDTLTGKWHSQKNELVVSDSNNTRLVIENTSGGTADFHAVGMEVDD